MDSPWEITSPLTAASSSMSSYVVPRSTRPSRSSTFSSTTSSFDQVDRPGSDSEDEIVYSVASLPEIEKPPTPYYTSESSDADEDDEDDNDYVVLRPRPLESGVATPNASANGEGSSATATYGRAALRGQVMVVQLRSQLKELSINPESPPPTPTLPDTSTSDRAAGAATRRNQKQVDTTAAGLPTPDITPLKEWKPQTGGVISLKVDTTTTILSTPRVVATPVPSVKKAKKATEVLATLPTTVTTTPSDNVKSKKKKKKITKVRKAAPNPSTTGASPASKQGKAVGQVDRSMVQEASTYITSYLSNPKAQANSVCRLTLLQSLIIELGLMTSALKLPASLKSAKTFLKSHAFLNVKDYVSTRAQGPDAVRKILFPSKSALIKDIRTRKSAASLKWVKEHGLQVLLVGCYY